MKTLIKLVPLLAFMASGVTHAQDDAPKTMTDEQKTQVMELLKTFQDANMSRKLQLIAKGITAITPAAANESEAMNLFERCYKKKEFDDNENKKDKDWREWKTQNKDKLNSPANKRALRYQAQWALITLKAGMEPEDTFDPSKYAPQAIALLTEVMRDTKVLEEATGPYNGSMISGPIGELYELSGCKQQGWPDSIMDPFRVIEGLILAPSREKGDITSMRKGWSNLITMQKIKVAAEEKAAAERGENTNTGRNNPARRRGGMRNVENNIENLYWLCELDCYRAGDEVNASGNMLRIIRGTSDPARQEMLITQLSGILEDTEEQNQDANGRARSVYGLMGMGRNNNRRTATPAAGQTPPRATTTAEPAAPAPTAPPATTPSSIETTPSSTQPTTPARPATPHVEEIML